MEIIIFCSWHFSDFFLVPFARLGSIVSSLILGGFLKNIVESLTGSSNFD
jgi:hypothetical protein